MTRRDYQKLAEAVRRMRLTMQADARLTRVSSREQDAIDKHIITHLAFVLGESNPNFDSAKFTAACRRVRA